MPWLPWYFKPAQVFSGVHTLSYLSDGKCWLLRRMILQSMGSLAFVGVVACDMRQIRFCVVRCAGKTNWCSYVIGGLSGWGVRVYRDFARIVRGLFGGCEHWFRWMVPTGGGSLCVFGNRCQYKTFMWYSTYRYHNVGCILNKGVYSKGHYPINIVKYISKW